MKRILLLISLLLAGLAAGAVAAALMTEGLKGVHEFKELL